MKNVLENLNKYVVYAIYALLVVSLLNTCNVRSAKKENTKLRKEFVTLTQEVDSLTTVLESVPTETADKKEINDIMEEKMWKFLELEELSDKNKVPINELKHKNNQ